MSATTWTSREVEYDPHPKYKQGRADGGAWDQLFEAYVDYYYAGTRKIQPGVSACDGVINLSGFPWWLPRWMARRTAARIAANQGVGGEARYIVRRVVLVS